MNRDEGNKRFKQYLAGLVIAAVPLTPALASPPPATPTVTATKVSFAKNLKDKLTAAAPLQMLAEGKYNQKFGKLYVQYGPFVEVIQPKAALTEAAPRALSPSEAFALVKNA